MKNRTILILLTIFFLSIIPIDISAQCAMCKQSVESSMRSPGSIAKNLNAGILYLMAVPYLAIMFIFRKQVYQVWKKITARFSRA